MFLKPDKIVARLGLMEGMRVADFGAGAGGFYAKALSARVGHTGKVYAIEVQKDFVKSLESNLKERGISNIVCLWGDIEHARGTKIADNSMDAVVISNVLFQVEDKIGLIDEAKRILKKNGKALLIDWQKSFGNFSKVERHLINPEKAKDMFTKRGFKFVENIDVSANHYGIIFEV